MTSETTHDTLAGRGLMTIQGFGLWSNVCRAQVHKLIAKGDLHAVKCGRRTLIPVEEAIRWRNALPSARATS